MAIGPREVAFTIDVDTGRVMNVEKGSGVTQTGPNPTVDPPFQEPGKEQNSQEQQQERAIGDEIEDIKRGKRHLRVAEVIQITESPGCVYWNGKRWVKYC